MTDATSTINTSPSLAIRKLNVDFSQGFDRRWHGGDAFRTAYHNALSMSFVAGEQGFIDAVKRAATKLDELPPQPEHAALKESIRDFCGQEATHRHVHAQFNAVLEKQGFKNHLEPRIWKRIDHAKNFNPMHALAATAAYEHYTSVLSQGMLDHPSHTEPMTPMMRQIWRWHAMEETEHKAVAFDLYRALGGNLRWRRRWFVYASLTFAADTFRQTVNNLWHDGALFKPSTWWSAAKFFFGSTKTGGGWVWITAKPLAQYWRKDFHPWQHDNKAVADAYAQANGGDWRVVRAGAAASV